MRPARISLHVDRLVLHGLPSMNADALGEALRGELHRLLAERGVPESWLEAGAADRLDAGEIAVSAGRGVTALASELARAALSTTGERKGHPSARSRELPRTLKGAIVSVDVFNPVATAIVFQYNPDTMTRSLQPQAYGEGSDRAEVDRFRGPPIETIKLDVEIDASEQLASGAGVATQLGIYPQLSALEMLIYPKTAQVILNTALLAAGTLEVVPPTGPMTLLIWGARRVLPVKLTELSVTEEAYDTRLNPTRAKVSLGLRVLTYADLPLTHPGYALFLAHQAVKEAMAVAGSVRGMAAAASDNLKL